VDQAFDRVRKGLEMHHMKPDALLE
jgi:hypothetical protein